MKVSFYEELVYNIDDNKVYRVKVPFEFKLKPEASEVVRKCRYEGDRKMCKLIYVAENMAMFKVDPKGRVVGSGVTLGGTLTGYVDGYGFADIIGCEWNGFDKEGRVSIYCRPITRPQTAGSISFFWVPKAYPDERLNEGYRYDLKERRLVKPPKEGYQRRIWDMLEGYRTTRITNSKGLKNFEEGAKVFIKAFEEMEKILEENKHVPPEIVEQRFKEERLKMLKERTLEEIFRL